MSNIKLVVIILILGAIVTMLNAAIFIGLKKPDNIAQIAPECPKGLAEQAAEKDFNHKQSQFEFESRIKGAR